MKSSTNVKVIVGAKDVEALNKELSHLDKIDRKTLIISLIKDGKGLSEMYEDEFIMYNKEYEGVELLVLERGDSYIQAKIVYKDEAFRPHGIVKHDIRENKKREEERQKIVELDRQIDLLITEQYL